MARMRSKVSVIQNGPNRTSKMAAGGHFEIMYNSLAHPYLMYANLL